MATRATKEETKLDSISLDFVKMEREAAERAEAQLSEAGDMPIPLGASSGMVSAMHTAIIVRQNEQIIGLLRKLLYLTGE
jgi:hypothetical protein